jgi:hypothetical protein
MLPKLLDTAGFQSATSMTPDEFANAALGGMVPRAVGMLNTTPLWPEHIVQAFCKEIGRAFNHDWTNAITTAKANAADIAADYGLQTTPAATPAATVEAPREEFPDEMTRSMAERYCDVGGSFLDKHVKSGLLNSRRDGMFVVFKREDLDAFMQLPVFKYRKRIGYRGGKRVEGTPTKIHRTPHGSIPVAEPAKPTIVPSALVTETAAADHLGLHPEALAIARRGGSGPAVTLVGGKPCYRPADLDAWKAAQAAMTPTDTRAPFDAELSAQDAAEYLGVKPATLQYWRLAESGPRVHRKDGTGRGSKIYYLVSALEEFKRTHNASIIHSQRMAANPNVRGPVKTNGKAHGKGKGKAKRTPPAGVKAVAQNGSRIRH